MKKYIHLIISVVLIGIIVATILLSVEQIVPPVALLEILFCVIILFIANVSSGITYGILKKQKILYLIVFSILNIVCIVLLIYLLIIFVLFVL